MFFRPVFHNTHLKQSNTAALGFRDPSELEGTTLKKLTNKSYF